jgi:hypothetical protein
VKTFALALFLVAAGCASPAPPAKDPAPPAHPDLATPLDVGGNGPDPDMSRVVAGGDLSLPPGVHDLAMSTSGDLATTTTDLAMSSTDLAMSSTTDLAVPPPPPDMARPPAPPDMACKPTIVGSACNIYPQCGCAPGQNCNVENTTTGASQCAAAGTTPNWNACDPNGNGDGVCTIGTSCVNGVCDPFCTVDADCGPHAFCYQVYSTDASGNQTAIPGFKVCTSNCDPTNPQSNANGANACGPNVNCIADPNTSNTVCTQPVKSTGTQGRSCVTGGYLDPSKCAIGYVCNPTGTCSKSCHVVGGSECTGLQVCNSFNPAVHVNTTEIGYCN